jgi:hypothetical protein
MSKVIGIQTYSFKDKVDTTKTVTLYHITVADLIDVKYGVGHSAKQFWLSEDKAAKLVPDGILSLHNKEVDVSFDERGKVKRIDVLE